MREVAWVVFDEIHYMRDKGTLLNSPYARVWLSPGSSWSSLGGDNHPTS